MLVRVLEPKLILGNALIGVTVSRTLTSLDSAIPEVTMATTTKTRTRKAWAKPRVECYETRPEVTAYAGDGGPWAVR